MLVTNEEAASELKRITRTMSVNCEEDISPRLLYGLKGQLPAGLTSNYVKISEIHSELLSIINKFNSKVGDTLAKEEKEIAASYAKKLDTLHKEMSILKFAYENAAKPPTPGEELGRWRTEAQRLTLEITKLTSQYERLKKENQELLERNEQLANDKESSERRLRKAARKNKRLSIELRRMEKEAKPTAAAEAQSVTYKSACEDSGEKDDFDCTRSADNIKDSATSSPALSVFFGYLMDKKYTKAEALARSERYMKAALSRQGEILAKVQQQLAVERRVLQRVRLSHVDAASSRNELESLFLECVEEVRSQIAHNRSSADQSQDSVSYYGSALPKRALAAYDKARIMELFMCNDRLLQTLYDIMFKARTLRGENELELPVLAPHRSKSKAESYVMKEPSTKNELDFDSLRLALRRTKATQRCQTNSPAEARIRRKVFSSPMHAVKRGKLVIVKGITGQVLGKKML